MTLNPRTASTDFFVAGGTLPASAPSYVSRPADEQLFTAASAGEFCYVLTTRQMGKSSLMVRTAGRLKDQGIRTAIVDLTGIGRSVEDTWYLDFLSVLADKLGLAQDVEAWWHAHATLGAVLRFRSFLRDVVLTEISDQIVIFVDEIDSTLGLPFADDFFAAVRAIYNERADDAQFKRLTFIFLGVAAPADLIRDRTRTPFNIGQGILLRDFDRTDATVLEQGLDAVYPGQGKPILDRICEWTNGHPYLTQRLCREVVDQKRMEPWTPLEVDQVVTDLFLSDQTNREQNLQFVQDRILKHPRRRELLKLYGKVRANWPVANDEQSMLQNQLKLAGLVTTDERNLRVHNVIYRSVFDEKWITANIPRDNNRLVTYAAIALAALIVGLAGFVLLYNSNVQHQSEQLQLEFAQANTPVERLDRLAQLFDLQGLLTDSDFDDTARRLFFDLDSQQDQLALLQVDDDRVVRVIKGLYTALADVDKSGENDVLLTAMRDALQKIGARVADAPRLYNEIDYWLQARIAARQNRPSEAVAEYGKAIQANVDDNNPSLHFERAQIRLEQPAPIYPDVLSDLDAAIAAARKVSIARPGEPDSGTTAILTPTQLPTASSPLVTPQFGGTLIPVATGEANSKPVVTASVSGTTIAPTIEATTNDSLVPIPIATDQPKSLPTPAASQPFRSQFISFVQIASAVRRLVDSSPGLGAFLANSSESYSNLQNAQLVRTLDPSPLSTPTSPLWTQGSGDIAPQTIYQLAVCATDSQRLYAGTRTAGVYATMNAGASWTQSSLSNVLVRGVAVNPTNCNEAYAFAWGQGMMKTIDGGKTWQAVNSGLGEPYGYSVLVDPSNPQVVYAGTDTLGVYVSMDGGTNWSHMAISNTAVMGLSLGADNTVYVATFGMGVYSLKNNIATALHGGDLSATANVFAVVAIAPSTVFAATETGLYRSDNGGTTWKLIPSLSDTGRVFSVLINPRDTQIVYAGVEFSGVYRSANGGPLTAYSLGLPSTGVRALASGSATSTYLHAGTVSSGTWRIMYP